jgi:hypothetical protein
MPERIVNDNESCGAGCGCSVEGDGLLVSPIDRRKFLSLGASQWRQPRLRASVASL